jgi:hypothetical protein
VGDEGGAIPTAQLSPDLAPTPRPTPTHEAPTLLPQLGGQVGALAFDASVASPGATVWAVLVGAFGASGVQAGEVADDVGGSICAVTKGGEC